MSLSLNFLRGPRNASGDVMRGLAMYSGIMYPLPFIWNVYQHGIVPDPLQWAGGFALVLPAAAAAIGFKDVAVAKANQTIVQTDASEKPQP